ncbi:hypothetical protein QTP88_004066 [Uroleucon formosanum]
MVHNVSLNVFGLVKSFELSLAGPRPNPRINRIRPAKKISDPRYLLMGLCEKCSSIIKKQTRISEGRMIGWIKEVEEMPGIEKIPEDKFREIFKSSMLEDRVVSVSSAEDMEPG